MRRENPEPEPEAGEETRHPGAAAQEDDPEIGPGSHPDAEQAGSPDDTTPGGRP